MGNGTSVETGQKIVPAPRHSNANYGRQASHPAIIQGAVQTERIPKHDEFPRARTQGSLTTTIPKKVKSQTLDRALPCSLTNRLLGSNEEAPMPTIKFGTVQINRRSHQYIVAVAGEPTPELLKLIRKVIERVMRFNTTLSTSAHLDPKEPRAVVLKTSRKLGWKKFVRPCLDDVVRAFRALEIFGLTEEQFKKQVRGLGKRDRNLLAHLLEPMKPRIGFDRTSGGHVRIDLHANNKRDAKPNDVLIGNLCAWVLELQKIGEFDAIFALLDRLDLSMVGEFRDLKEKHLPCWQEKLVVCYLQLTRASPEVLKERHWINFSDLIADLKTELIVGLCNRNSGYFDPVMAAKVMLRQARFNSYSGELATGDIVIEALIATGISPKQLAKMLDKREGSSEAHWWGKLKRACDDPGEMEPAKLVGRPEQPLPRFSLQLINEGKHYVRLHNVASKSPVRGVMVYVLQELVTAVFPGSLTQVRFEDDLLLSFTGDDVARASVHATSSAESMFRSFAAFDIADEKVANYFALHRDNGTVDLFSHGIAKLFARPGSSKFAIVQFPDRFDYVDYGVDTDEQRLDRAEHLMETITDLAMFKHGEPAKALLSLMRSDLQMLWPGEPVDWTVLRFSELCAKLAILREAPPPSPIVQDHVWRNGIIPMDPT